jgi:hypothetical protein
MVELFAEHLHLCLPQMPSLIDGQVQLGSIEYGMTTLLKKP